MARLGSSPARASREEAFSTNPPSSAHIRVMGNWTKGNPRLTKGEARIGASMMPGWGAPLVWEDEDVFALKMRLIESICQARNAKPYLVDLLKDAS